MAQSSKSLLKRVKNRVGRSVSHGAGQKYFDSLTGNTDDGGDLKSEELNLFSTHSLPVEGSLLDNAKNSTKQSKAAPLKKLVIRGGGETKKDKKEKDKKEKDKKKDKKKPKKKKKNEKQQDYAVIFSGLDMVTPKYVLERVEEVRQDVTVVKLDIEDLVISGNEQAEGILTLLALFFFSGDREWETIQFVDSFGPNDLKLWLRSMREAMDFFEDLYREQPDVLGFDTITFQGKIQVEEGSDVKSFVGVLRNIKRQRRVSQVDILVDEVGINEGEVDEFFQQCVDSDGEIQEDVIVAVTFAWIPNPMGLNLVDACLRGARGIVEDEGGLGGARRTSSNASDSPPSPEKQPMKGSRSLGGSVHLSKSGAAAGGASGQDEASPQRQRIRNSRRTRRSKNAIPEPRETRPRPARAPRLKRNVSPKQIPPKRTRSGTRVPHSVDISTHGTRSLRTSRTVEISSGTRSLRTSRTTGGSPGTRSMRSSRSFDLNKQTPTVPARPIRKAGGAKPARRYSRAERLANQSNKPDKEVETELDLSGVSLSSSSSGSVSSDSLSESFCDDRSLLDESMLGENLKGTDHSRSYSVLELLDKKSGSSSSSDDVDSADDLSIDQTAQLTTGGAVNVQSCSKLDSKLDAALGFSKALPGDANAPGRRDSLRSASHSGGLAIAPYSKRLSRPSEKLATDAPKGIPQLASSEHQRRSRSGTKSHRSVSLLDSAHVPPTGKARPSCGGRRSFRDLNWTAPSSAATEQATPDPDSLQVTPRKTGKDATANDNDGPNPLEGTPAPWKSLPAPLRRKGRSKSEGTKALPIRRSPVSIDSEDKRESVPKKELISNSGAKGKEPSRFQESFVSRERWSAGAENISTLMLGKDKTSNAGQCHATNHSPSQIGKDISLGSNPRPPACEDEHGRSHSDSMLDMLGLSSGDHDDDETIEVPTDSPAAVRRSLVATGGDLSALQNSLRLLDISNNSEGKMEDMEESEKDETTEDDKEGKEQLRQHSKEKEEAEDQKGNESEDAKQELMLHNKGCKPEKDSACSKSSDSGSFSESSGKNVEAGPENCMQSKAAKSGISRLAAVAASQGGPEADATRRRVRRTLSNGKQFAGVLGKLSIRVEAK